MSYGRREICSLKASNHQSSHEKSVLPPNLNLRGLKLLIIKPSWTIKTVSLDIVKS